MIKTPTKPVDALADMEVEHNLPIDEEPVSPRSRWRWRNERKKVIGISLFLLGVVLLSVLFGPFRWALGFQKTQASHEVFAGSVTAPGFLQAPIYDLQFSSAVVGAVSDIYVQLGQKVVAGQAVAKLGYNTYAAQLHAAEVAVDAAHNEVNAAEAHVANVFAFINSTVVLAQVTLQANLNNRQALLQQAQANINFAQVKLATDLRTLNAVQQAADAAIKSAKQTEQNAIAACKAAASSATPTPTTSSNNGSSNYATTASSSDPNSSTNSSTNSCIQAAKDAFQAAETAAQQSVVTAQGTVAQDRAALRQAQANADVSLTAINGVIAESRVGIDVARLNPERTNAILALTAAEFTYRTSLAALLVAEQTLALTTLVAPHDGVVTAIIGSIGGQPGALENFVPASGIELQSEHGGLTFIQLTDAAHVGRVWTYVDQTDIAKVAVGQAATFTLRAYPGHQFTGTVIQIAPNGIGFPAVSGPLGVRYLTTIAINGDSVGNYVLYHHMEATVTISS